MEDEIMELYLVFFSALAPVAVALWYIFRKDSVQPEPGEWLAKAFGYGVLSAFLSFAFSTPIGAMLGLELDAFHNNVPDAFADAFLLAAVPEELAKLIMLWLLLRKNPHFDEKFDGIVYAVCIGMGFAGLENVLYLVQGIEDGSWVSTGVVRALLTIPGHFFFAVLMGYYYSICYFGINRSIRAKAMVLIAPVVAHGLFDALLMSMQVDEGLAGICMIAFIYFLHKLKTRGKEKIESLMNQ